MEQKDGEQHATKATGRIQTWDIELTSWPPGLLISHLFSMTYRLIIKSMKCLSFSPKPPKYPIYSDIKHRQ